VAGRQERGGAASEWTGDGIQGVTNGFPSVRWWRSYSCSVPWVCGNQIEARPALDNCIESR
jgi:hypothetical protein